jgi:serine/threonine-protein kinase
MPEEEEILASAERRVGTVLNGKYRIERVLGVGGMATVYAATHRNRKRFAVKMLHPEFSVRKDVRSRFVREGYLANSVNHPGAVVILDDDVDEAGAPFIVMELLEGVTVEALYAPTKTPIPIREALGIAYQLLEVLEAAHEKSVVHRDVKPANLFVLRGGQLKVVDFGIARLRDDEAGVRSTRTGATLGTPAFMAPEQAASGDVDSSSDVWSVGATLFTMLSARYVHEGENARQVMIHAATNPARSLGAVAPNLPAPVIAFVDRALSFEKSARWPSAAAMRDALVEVHRELFGAEPSASELGRFVGERTSAASETAATEPSPNAGRDHLTTTSSTPVSTASDRAIRTRWALGLGATAALGTTVFFALSKRVDDTVPSAATRPIAESRAPESPPPPPTASAAPEQPTIVEVAPLSTPSPQPTTVQQPKARPVATSKTSSASPAQASPPPSPSATSSNPLKLELQ